MEKHTAYLSLGSNLGQKKENMRMALRLIDRDESTRVTAVSSLYSTKPVGVTDQPDFLNAVVRVETTRGPRELLGLCELIEHSLGRVRTLKWGPRVIDVDIILYDSLTINEDDLIIPHPRMMKRAFVLIPLAEIAPDMVLFGRLTARQTAEESDMSGIERIQDSSWRD